MPELSRHCADCAAPRLFVALCLDGHAECLDLVCVECGAGYTLAPLPLTVAAPAAPAPRALRDVA
jgi:hypothetical protein